jgi:cell division septal protein FtsQ
MTRGEESALFVPRRRRLPTGGLVLVLLLAGAVFAYARLAAQPLWTVRAISVEGNRSIRRDELLGRLGLRPGLPWWRIPRHAVARVRAASPRLQSLSLSWRWPRDLVVQVHERESCLRVLGPPALEVAPDGVILEPSEALDPADLPLLTGDLPADLRPGASCVFPSAGPGWGDILELSRSTPELWKAISEIHFAGGTDFRIFLRDGRKVVLWETDVNKELRQQVTRILAELRRKGVEDAVIDLRFRDQAVVRLPEESMADSAARLPAAAGLPGAAPPPGGRPAPKPTPNRRQRA